MNSTFFKLVTFIIFLSSTIFAGEYLFHKSSPFFNDSITYSDSGEISTNAENNLDFDRINLWPLYYNHKSRVSILWPLISYNEDGNACYPLYSHYYNQEFNLLWPAVSIGLTNNGSRILNTYWEDQELVSFPFFFKNEDMWLAPLIAGHSSSNWYSIMPPLWIHWPENRSWILGTAYCLKNEGEKYTSKTGQTNTFGEFSLCGLWPLYGQGNIDGLFIQGSEILPAYRFQYLDESKTNVLASAQLYFPFYFDYKDKDRTLMLTTLYGSFNGKNSSAFFTPLLSAGTIDNSDFVNVLGLAYQHSINTNQNRSACHFMWPLFSQSRRTGKYAYRKTSLAWPIIHTSQYASGKSSFSIFPLFGYDLHTDPRHEVPSRPLYIRNNGLSSKKRHHSLLVFPWLSCQSGLRYSENKNIEIPLELINTNYNADTYSGRSKYDYDKIDTCSNIWQHFAAERYIPHEFIASSLWPLWHFDKTTDCNLNLSFLEFVYSYNLNQVKDTTKSRFLWQLIRYDRLKESKSLDLFPFITYDKNPAESKTKFSVLWRLFSCQKEADKTKLHLFFIPCN